MSMKAIKTKSPSSTTPNPVLVTVPPKKRQSSHDQASSNRATASAKTSRNRKPGEREPVEEGDEEESIEDDVVSASIPLVAKGKVVKKAGLAADKEDREEESIKEGVGKTSTSTIGDDVVKSRVSLDAKRKVVGKAGLAADEEEDKESIEEGVVKTSTSKRMKVVVDEPVEEEEETMVDGIVGDEEIVTFESLGIDASLVLATKELGWTRPTPIQCKAIPAALQGKDVVALAETGSGKTGAFALPILHRLIRDPKRLSNLILAPTRELAVQIHDVFQALGTGIGAVSVCIVGGVDMVAQAVSLAKRPHIITATPGRLVDHLKHTKGFALRDLRTLVMDEADRMLSMDFEEEINTILSVVPREGRTTMLFSATMTSKVEKLQRASIRPGKDSVRVEVSEKYGVVKNLDQKFLFVPASARDKYLVWLLQEFSGKSAIVFTATCSHAQRLAFMLKHLDLGGAVCLHGQMNQPARLGALNKFKSQVGRILIATDVAARGLDIPSVDLVVNYDVPQTGKDYIHRVGRTARAGRAGRAVTVVSQYDVEAFQRIEKNLGTKLEQLKADKKIVDTFEETVAEAARRANADMREEESSGTNGKKKFKKKGGSYRA